MPQSTKLSKTYPVDEPTRIADIENAIIADEAVMVATNPNVDQTILAGRMLLSPLANPAAPSIVVTGGAAGSQSYVVVAKLGTGTSAASAATSTAGSGPTTLDATHFNTVSWLAVASATGYDVYRTIGGATQGLIGSTTTGLSLKDNGLVGDTTIAPAINSTGLISGVVQDSVAAYAVSGAISTLGLGAITKAGIAVMTLVQPISGAPAAGGQDGAFLTLIDTDGDAHTVTTGTNGINGNKQIATFNGTKYSYVTLRAYGGVWIATTLSGVALT